MGDEVRSQEGRRSGLLPASLNFLPSNKVVMFRGKEETPPKVGYIYTYTGAIMSLCVQLSDPLDEYTWFELFLVIR
jgi:hypothetical protein